jgi:hypothetical protein
VIVVLWNVSGGQIDRWPERKKNVKEEGIFT